MGCTREALESAGNANDHEAGARNKPREGKETVCDDRVQETQNPSLAEATCAGVS